MDRLSLDENMEEGDSGSERNLADLHQQRRMTGDFHVQNIHFPLLSSAIHLRHSSAFSVNWDPGGAPVGRHWPTSQGR
jgi:hypothetical protein